MTARKSVSAPTVVLLHGIAMGRWAMVPIGHTLRSASFRVLNLGYASCGRPLDELAGQWLPAALERAGLAQGGIEWDVVTHSMGALVLRRLLSLRGVPAGLKRVVMIAPPNHGTPLVDRIGHWWVFRTIYGSNGCRLGTDAHSFSCQLGPWPEGPELGIIAGDRPLTGLFATWTGRPGDGKVPITSTRLRGAQGHVVLPYSHTGILFRRATHHQVLSFVRNGYFMPAARPDGQERPDASIPPKIGQSR